MGFHIYYPMHILSYLVHFLLNTSILNFLYMVPSPKWLCYWLNEGLQNFTLLNYNAIFFKYWKTLIHVLQFFSSKCPIFSIPKINNFSMSILNRFWTLSIAILDRSWIQPPYALDPGHRGNKLVYISHYGNTIRKKNETFNQST